MKIIFASDIHGSYAAAKKIISIVEKEKADKLVLLGDLLYHGPRNPLPEEYEPEKVFTLLNQYKEKIIAIRGNCDSEVDQMVLEFPMMADYALLLLDEKEIFITHGHLFSQDNLPTAKEGVMISGHTHVNGVWDVHQDEKHYICMNPGSASLPKEKQEPTYMIYENREFRIMSFDEELQNSYAFK